MRYDFGQPVSGIMQTAFIVPDIHAAIDHWVSKLVIGPWFLLGEFTGIDPQYRGAPSTSKCAIAMSFAGQMNIELIQPLDDQPSVYKDTIDERGYGFHHFGVSTLKLDEDIAAYRDKGYELAFFAGVPTGGHVAYMDTRADMPGMIEFIEGGPAVDAAFTSFYQATLGWDGSNPIRKFG